MYVPLTECKKCRTKGLCAICYGQTRTIVAAGGYLLEGRDTPLGRTSRKLSTIIMDSHWLREHISWLWRVSGCFCFSKAAEECDAVMDLTCNFTQATAGVRIEMW
jgi:hypothetical protein